MKLDLFDYNLPKERIAQHPCEKRDESKLMVLNMKNNSIEHRKFKDILEYIKPDDCLVFNNSKVLPARLLGKKKNTGADVEFLLIKRIEGDYWKSMVRPGKKLKPGDEVVFSDSLFAKIIDFAESGLRIIEFQYEGMFTERLEEVGHMPLPPYIERISDDEDSERYQTVYCKYNGSVAAPTAGLHFTDELIEHAQEKRINLAFLTLHVGIGTFRPVKTEEVEEHEMHFEEYEISEEAADTINQTIKKGGRIFAVGTTSTRCLESASKKNKAGLREIISGRNKTDIFIYPSYEFKVVDCLVTNFHLPKSTLLMLVSALYDREKIIEAYETAVEEEYRFFSYGDAMLIHTGDEE